MSATEQKAPTPIAAYLFLLFMAFACVGAVISLTDVESLPSSETAPPDLLNGSYSHKIESQFETTLPYRQFAIGLWSSLRYRLFKTGHEKVVIGKNDWLFTAEEFEIAEDAAHNLQSNLEKITAIHKHLARHNLGLKVVLIPPKTFIKKQKLDFHHPAAFWKKAHKDTLAHLKQDDLLIDASDPLYKLSLASESFLKYDTHWTPEGAEAVARHISNRLPFRSQNPVDYITTLSDSTQLKGDLVDFIAPAPFANWLGFTEETINRYQTTTPTHQAGLFGNVKTPIILIGTSYSANPNWHFEGFLKSFLKTDILNLAEEGSGPFEPMHHFLRNTPLPNPSYQYILWEVPLRYLLTPSPTLPFEGEDQ